jgi:hypothetical protein
MGKTMRRFAHILCILLLCVIAASPSTGAPRQGPCQTACPYIPCEYSDQPGCPRAGACYCWIEWQFFNNYYPCTDCAVGQAHFPIPHSPYSTECLSECTWTQQVRQCLTCIG